MGIVVDSFTEIFKKSFDANLLLTYLVMLVLSFLGFLAIVAVFAVPAVIVYILLQFSLPAIMIYGIILVLFFIAMILFVSLIDGMTIHIANDCLQGKQHLIGGAYKKTAPRVVTIAIVNILISAIFLLLLLVLMLPAIFSLLALLPSLSSQSIQALLQNAPALLSAFIPVILWFVLGLLVFFLIMFFSLPFLAICTQVPLFENIGAFQAMGRIFELGKKNYITNFGFLLLFGIVVFLATALVGAVEFLFQLLLMGPAALMGSATSAQMTGPFLAFFIILLIITIILRFALELWLLAIGSLFNVTIYLIDVKNK